MAKPERSEWACLACTYFNTASADMCDMCGTPRGFAGIRRSNSGTVKNDEPPEVRLEFVQGTSSKFWQVKVSGCTTIVTFGRIGTPGQTDTKVHANEGEARKFAAQIQGEKERKGYK